MSIPRFNRDKFLEAQIPVYVVGVGMVGGWVARGLASIGVPTIVFDHDTVSIRNGKPGEYCNQIYPPSAVDRLKVEVLAEILLRDTGVKITARPERFDGVQRLEGVVFCCPDKMSVRREVFARAKQCSVKWMIETRLSTDLTSGRVYCVDPEDGAHCVQYEPLLRDIEAIAPPEADEGCASALPSAPLGMGIATLAVTQFQRWWLWYSGLTPTDKLDHELFYSPTLPVMLETRRFE